MPNQKRETNSLASRPIAQFMRLHVRSLLSLDLAETEQEARELDGKMIALSNEALPVYEAVGKAYAEQYKKMPKHDYGSSPHLKAIGVTGNDAIHASLNECGIFYKTDQLFASFKSDRVWHDFVLAPSGIKLEVKTSTTNYLNLNERHWQGSKAPDVVISLKYSQYKDLILLEFRGWLPVSKVNAKNLERIERKNASYFRCNVAKMNPPTDIHEFLKGLANDGTRYLAGLKT